MSEYCKKCGEFLILQREIENHTCESYLIEDEEYGDCEVYGTTVENALEKYAKQRNEESELLDNEIVVKVDEIKYKLSASIDTHYRVEQI